MASDFRGEFTKKIDQELIMRHSTAEEKAEARSWLDKEAEEKKHLELQRSQEEAAARRLREVEDALRCRTDFLRARFPNMTEGTPPQGRGILYRFQKGGEFSHDASLELLVRDNESRQAMFVESSMEVTGRLTPKHDYITYLEMAGKRDGDRRIRHAPEFLAAHERYFREREILQTIAQF
jgi:hypothetical protein